MAISTIQTNNKLVQYRRDIIREFVRGNRFSPYMGEGMTAIIRTLTDPKKGGEQINIPLVTRLAGTATSTGTLTGNEEAIDNYGMRVYVDWARHAVATTDAEEQKDSADVFGEAKPLLSDWGKELQRDEIIEAMMALPSEAAPVGLGSDDGQRVNGILYEAATATQHNSWATHNIDRVVYGSAVGNYSGVHATDLAKIDTTNDRLTASVVSLYKRRAKTANPRIRPYKTDDGREYFVLFTDSYAFRDLKADLETVNKDARPRNVGSNPIFQDGDQIYDGVIIREVEDITTYVENTWTDLLTAGNTSTRVSPVFMCGQSAIGMPWARLPVPTFRKEDDYQFITGAGVKMCYGVAKIFKQTAASQNRQWGMLTGFVSTPADA